MHVCGWGLHVGVAALATPIAPQPSQERMETGLLEQPWQVHNSCAPASAETLSWCSAQA
jgi:hypothetical protein